MFSVIRIKDGKIMAQFGTYDRADQYLESCVLPYKADEQPEEYKNTAMSDYRIELRPKI